MELKVWVDGTQRIVCGITEQTTVQEVVIALAQATGRTGRYTLVEKSRTTEKMLPPADHPLKVLSKWGDKADEVKFVLRRTGASSTMSESGEDNVISPGRTAYRSSLPPQLKSRQKKEVVSNDKEKKRKSFISGETNSNNQNAVIGGRKNTTYVSQGNNERTIKAPPKKALIPPPFQNQAAVTKNRFPPPNTRNVSPIQRKYNSLPPPPPYQEDPPPSYRSETKAFSPKKTLMPSLFKSDFPSKTAATGNQDGSSNIVGHGYRTSDGGEIVPPAYRSRKSEVVPVRPMMSQSSLIETATAKAHMQFTRLVMEQHHHVTEQSQTMKSLDEEIEKYLSMIQFREKNAAMIKKEIEDLERSVEENETELNNEQTLQCLLENEDSKGSNLKSKNARYESDISKTNDNIKEMENRMMILEKEIQREKILQARKTEEDTRRRYESTEFQVRKVNDDLSEVVSELKAVEDGIHRTDAIVFEKQVELEALNRELRQVNLQQFIRQTGSKVTVLPPDADECAMEFEKSTSSLNHNFGKNPSSATKDVNAGGVWV